MYSTSGSSRADRVLRDQMIVIDEHLALALAQLVQARPHRDRPHPAPQIAAAAVLADLAGARRRARGPAADEQPLAHKLLHVVEPRRPDPHPRERDIDLAHVVAVERVDRARAFALAHAHARYRSAGRSPSSAASARSGVSCRATNSTRSRACTCRSGHAARPFSNQCPQPAIQSAMPSSTGRTAARGGSRNGRTRLSVVTVRRLAHGTGRAVNAIAIFVGDGRQKASAQPKDTAEGSMVTAG